MSTRLRLSDAKILDVELTDLVRFEELKRGRMKKEEIQALFSQCNYSAIV